eukprot:1139524-Pelagomonas_calceolata.AAC.9
MAHMDEHHPGEQQVSIQVSTIQASSRNDDSTQAMAHMNDDKHRQAQPQTCSVHTCVATH